ncbi:MAG: hypothetical protein JNK23_13625 [Opitutaceae bacterium]|nr:hypothetical protein [Opitutaceae bacterium]
MQTPYAQNLSAANLFSRERRRQRMLKFLETFELRSWPVIGETGFLVPVTRADVREPAADRAPTRR